MLLYEVLENPYSFNVIIMSDIPSLKSLCQTALHLLVILHWVLRPSQTTMGVET